MMAAQAAVSGHDMAAATSLCAFLRSFGGILCVAILSSIMHSKIKTGLTQLAVAHPSYIFTIARVAENQSAIYADGVPDELRAQIVDIYMRAMRLAFYALLPFSVLLLLSTLGFEHRELNRQRKKTIEVFMNSRLLRPTICQLRWLRQPAHRCSSQRRWLADKPESRQTEDKQSKPDGKQNASDDSDGLREWDRTINEAISQAKRELSESSKPVASKPKHDDPGKPPTESPSPPRPDYVTTLGRVLMELPHQLEGFFAHGLDGNLYSDSVRFAEPRYSGMQLNGRH
ncbi:hypothetical protein LPJ70_007446, partial [Coemansia sp. RSA 2708]